MEYFYPLERFLPPAASPAGAPGGPGMGSHWAPSGFLGFQKIAQIVTFKGEILEDGSGYAHG